MDQAPRQVTYAYDGSGRLVRAQRGSLVPGQTGDILCPIGGDTDTDGQVDSNDYSRFDTGYNAGFSGWLNGDFNGDGNSGNSGDTILI